MQLEQDDVADGQTVPTEIARDTNIEFFKNRIQDFDPLPSVDRNFSIIYAAVIGEFRLSSAEKKPRAGEKEQPLLLHFRRKLQDSVGISVIQTKSSQPFLALPVFS